MAAVLQEEMALQEQGIASSQPTQQGIPRAGEWAAAADMTEMLSENSMNSLRMCGRKELCQQSGAGSWGTHIPPTLPFPHVTYLHQFHSPGPLTKAWDGFLQPKPFQTTLQCTKHLGTGPFPKLEVESRNENPFSTDLRLGSC